MAKKVAEKAKAKPVKKAAKKKTDSGRTSIKKLSFELAKEEYSDVRGKDMYELIKGVFAKISGALKGGANVGVPGFGMFKLVTRKARTGFNPRTKEKIDIPEKTSVKFKPNKEFKESLNA